LSAVTPSVPADGAYHLLAMLVQSSADSNAADDTVDLGTFNLQHARPDLAVSFVGVPKKITPEKRPA